MSQSLNVESDKKKIEQNYQKQLDAFQTQLIFKVRYFLIVQEQELKNVLKIQKDLTPESVQSRISQPVNAKQNPLINEAAAFQSLNSFPLSGKTTKTFADVGISTCSIDATDLDSSSQSLINTHKSMIHNVC